MDVSGPSRTAACALWTRVITARGHRRPPARERWASMFCINQLVDELAFVGQSPGATWWTTAAQPQRQRVSSVPQNDVLEKANAGLRGLDAGLFFPFAGTRRIRNAKAWVPLDDTADELHRTPPKTGCPISRIAGWIFKHIPISNRRVEPQHKARPPMHHRNSDICQDAW